MGCFFLSKLPLGAQQAPEGSGAEEASKEPHPQETRLNRTGVLAFQGLVPSSRAGNGATELCESKRLVPSTGWFLPAWGARVSRQVELSLCHGPSAVSAAVCIS